MVFLVISIPGGATNVSFYGLSVNVKFAWPNTISDAEDVFKNEVTRGMKLYHPNDHENLMLYQSQKTTIRECHAATLCLLTRRPNILFSISEQQRP